MGNSLGLNGETEEEVTSVVPPLIANNRHRRSILYLVLFTNNHQCSVQKSRGNLYLTTVDGTNAYLFPACHVPFNGKDSSAPILNVPKLNATEVIGLFSAHPFL